MHCSKRRNTNTVVVSHALTLEQGGKGTIGNYIRSPIATVGSNLSSAPLLFVTNTYVHTGWMPCQSLGGFETTYLIRPGAGYANMPTHTAPDLDILVGRVKVLETVSHVGDHSAQSFSAEQHSGPSHAEVFIGLQT